MSQYHHSTPVYCCQSPFSPSLLPTINLLGGGFITRWPFRNDRRNSQSKPEAWVLIQSTSLWTRIISCTCNHNSSSPSNQPTGKLSCIERAGSRGNIFDKSDYSLSLS